MSRGLLDQLHETIAELQAERDKALARIAELEAEADEADAAAEERYQRSWGPHYSTDDARDPGFPEADRFG